MKKQYVFCEFYVIIFLFYNKGVFNLKLTQNNETLAENKVLILYILNKIAKPITNNALYELVLAVQDMNYFYFQQFLLDLQETKYVICYTLDDETVYEITDVGKKALVLVEDLIPGIIKLKMEGNLKGNLNSIEERDSISAEYIPLSENEYKIKCKIVENNKNLFEVQLYAGSREQAKFIADNWQENAVSLYPQILKILSHRGRFLNKKGILLSQVSEASAKYMPRAKALANIGSLTLLLRKNLTIFPMQ